MVAATFRFYEELNDFLAPDRRKREFTVPCARAASVKHMIEALGVPHTEVELILVNGVSVGLDHILAEGDRVAVYPKFEAMDITPLLRIRPEPLRVTRFIADAHLGGLARLLRMAGFDTLYDNAYDDAELVILALREDRIILTRDIELLKRRDVTHGCYVRTIKAEAQFREIVARLHLQHAMRPFSLCLACNAPLREVAKGDVIDRLPPRVRDAQEQFSTCDRCGRIFWEGSHWRNMMRVLASVCLAGQDEGESMRSL
jgi:uncharacterized protein with PIN domain/sulfur carrier protein ThiS